MTLWCSPKERRSLIGNKYDEQKLAHKIAQCFYSEDKGLFTYAECLKKAWGLIKFEEELDWHTYCRIKYNRNDLNEDDPFVLDCAEGDDPASWVQNEIDCWADYSRAFEKKDIKYLISFYWGVRLSL